MLGRRYPYAEAGKAVSPIFAIGGAIGGVVASFVIPGAPPAVLNAVLWAALAAVTSFLVFSSEGPRPRPQPLWQAATADGVVAGIIATDSISIVDLYLGTGSGSNSGSSVSVAAFGATVGIGLLAGMAGGAALGLAAVPIVGSDRLLRVPAENPRKRRSKRKKKR
jgi:hypothetical protein